MAACCRNETRRRMAELSSGKRLSDNRIVKTCLCRFVGSMVSICNYSGLACHLQLDGFMSLKVARVIGFRCGN